MYYLHIFASILVSELLCYFATVFVITTAVELLFIRNRDIDTVRWAAGRAFGL